MMKVNVLEVVAPGVYNNNVFYGRIVAPSLPVVYNYINRCEHVGSQCKRWLVIYLINTTVPLFAFLSWPGN